MLRALALQRTTIALGLLVLLAFFNGFSQQAFAQNEATDIEIRVREIGAELRCPVCQNISVADSPSALAVEMRTVIRQKLEAGESRDEIIKYFVGVYGEEVLLNPPFRGFTLLAWAGALLAVVGGAVLLISKLRNSLLGRPNTATPVVPTHSPVAGATEGSDYYEKRLDAEFARYKERGA